MPTEPDSSRQIEWRRRPDLQVMPLEFSGRLSWGIKDPISLAYFELQEEEFFVLQRLDGRSTVSMICQEFNQRFRPQLLSTAELAQFLGQLISQGLVIAANAGYGPALVARSVRQTARQRLSRWTNVLCLRFRGIDPDPLLTWLLPRFGWIFSPAALVFGLLLIFTSATLVLVQFAQLVDRLPDVRAILSTPNLVWIPLLLCLVKVLHELGHGLACKRYGGECRELGVMLLILTPTLYCNVSDMWMVRSKWKRIIVSAAGMWVEALIAAICTLLWWHSSPGLFHSLCLNLMFICGISTFLFNGNPLLRYDGYFVLADWLEIPNLQQQSIAAIRSQLSQWFCGISDPGDWAVTRQRRVLLLAYGVAASTYRLMLTALIIWSLYQWLQPMGLEVVFQCLAAPLVILMAIRPAVEGFRFLNSIQNRQQINWRQFRFRTISTVALLILALSIPIPSRIETVALVDQDSAQPVYASIGGTLISSRRIGEMVFAGQEVARLSDPKLAAELLRLQSEFELAQLKLLQLERRRIHEPEVAALIPSVRESMRDFQAQLKQLQITMERMVLRAPQDGVILPGPWHFSGANHAALRTWAGSPLEDQNQNCYIPAGTTVCLVGPEKSKAALLLASQDDINLIQIGQVVHTAWRESPGEVLSGKVIEIAALDLETLPRDAVLRLALPAQQGSDGSLIPVGIWYLVKVRLDSLEPNLLRGAAGRAKIFIQPRSLSSLILRWATQTFAG